MIGPKRGRRSAPLAPRLRGGARGGWCGPEPRVTRAAGRGQQRPRLVPAFGGQHLRSAQVPRERILPPALSGIGGSGACRVPGAVAAATAKGRLAGTALRPAGCSESPRTGWSRAEPPRPHRAAHRRGFRGLRSRAAWGPSPGLAPTFPGAAAAGQLGPAAPQPQVWELPALL